MPGKYFGLSQSESAGLTISFIGILWLAAALIFGMDGAASFYMDNTKVNQTLNMLA